jgi:hypothetical protein
MAVKRNRATYIDHRATQLAASGLFSDWRGVEAAIVSEGYPDAATQLDNPARRERLDRVCAKAQKADVRAGKSVQMDAQRLALSQPRSVHYTEFLARMKSRVARR